MRPEVVYKRVPGGHVYHAFKDGADQPVCGLTARDWRQDMLSGRRDVHVHSECKRLCPWSPRVNAPMSEEELQDEINRNRWNMAVVVLWPGCEEGPQDPAQAGEGCLEA